MTKQGCGNEEARQRFKVERAKKQKQSRVIIKGLTSQNLGTILHINYIHRTPIITHNANSCCTPCPSGIKEDAFCHVWLGRMGAV